MTKSNDRDDFDPIDFDLADLQDEADDHLFSFEPKSNHIVADVAFVKDEDTFAPIRYNDLPRGICDDIDEIAGALLDPERGRIIITGPSQTGKSFLINQVIGNMSRYVEKIDAPNMHFIRLKRDALEDLFNHEGRYGGYISELCKKLECAEQSICFVTEDPTIASAIFNFSNKARMILEVSNATMDKLIEMESSGTTKIWASWQFIDTDSTYLPKRDLISLLESVMSDKMNKIFKVNLDKKLITSFVNYTLKQLPELVDKENGSQGKVVAPMGVWALALRRLCGVIALSESPEIRTGGKVAISRAVNSVFEDSRVMFEDYTYNDEPLDLVMRLPDGNILRLSPLEHDAGDDHYDKTPKEVTKLVFNDVDKINEALRQDILGQESAIETVMDSVIVPVAGLSDNEKPIRSFLFLGPTGVGKTKLATSLAENISDKPMNVVRIDMSEYSQSHEAAKLLGAPPGYAGFEKGGVLTGAIAKNPNSLILLDEIEKAHPKVWDSFLQILDAGRMTDGQGEVVDFTQSILVMTSNIGANKITKKSVGFAPLSDEQQYAERQNNAKKTVMNELEKIFRPEMINRIDEIVVFQELSRDTAYQIIRKELDILSERMKVSGYTLNNVSDDIVEDILNQSEFDKYGARDIQRVVLRSVSNPVAKSIVGKNETLSKTIELTFDKDKNIAVTRG